MPRVANVGAATVLYEPSFFEVSGKTQRQLPLPLAQIETYDDHRMAMAFALAACSGTAVTILDPGCTRKTFPTYWDVLQSVAKH